MEFFERLNGEALKRILFAHFHGHNCIECFIKYYTMIYIMPIKPSFKRSSWCKFTANFLLCLRWILQICKIGFKFDLYPFVVDTLFFVTGDIILYSTMVMEIMGGWKNTCADARFRHRHLLRNRKETKEEITTGLFMGQFKVRKASKIWDSKLNWILMKKHKFQLFFLSNYRYHNWWAYRYYVCELLALLNVIGKFLGEFYLEISKRFSFFDWSGREIFSP